MLTEWLETSKGGKWELWAFPEHEKCGKMGGVGKGND